MKTLLVISISIIMVCGAFHYQQTQQAQLHNLLHSSQSLQKKLKILKNDLAFLNRYAQELNFLTKKGWFKPHSRLIAAEKIKQASTLLNKTSFIFEPETTKEDQKNYSFKVSKIVLEANALLDTSIYDFIESILRDFPGVLVLRKLSLTRNEELNKKSFLALKQQRPPDFIRGEIIFEWISMGEKKNEE